ncbi:hypothetical protein SUGI_1006440 [Cryptomeria japonica]|nr:hypothetical protein SUGI_1006440 [Cryptomeria japonica]
MLQNLQVFLIYNLPECHFVSWVWGTRGHVSLRVWKPDVCCETNIKDNVFVTVVAFVQYHTLGEKASEAFSKLRDKGDKFRHMYLRGKFILSDFF